uniref:Uncharacterized protein n=1 Tax=Rhizophora mucronata TaxID=61149 RepID=A0A2P2LRZ4_RHIMU
MHRIIPFMYLVGIRRLKAPSTKTNKRRKFLWLTQPNLHHNHILQHTICNIMD